MTFEATTPSGTLGQRTLSAVQWQLAASVVQRALQFGVTILLARLLTPEVFGLIALAMIVIGFATLVADLGLGPSLIQCRVLSERHVRVAFTVTTALGVLFTFVLYEAAPYSGWVLRSSALPAVLRALAFAFVLAGVGSTARALLRRNLNFRGLFIIEFASYLIGYACVAIALAVLGWGVWSLVWGALVQRALATVFALLMVRHSLRPLVAYGELRDLLRFGTGASLASIANYAARNGDNVIVGRSLGPAALGLYGHAYSLMNLTSTYLAGILGSVLFPALSEIHFHPQRVGRAYLMAVKLTTIVTLPVLCGTIVAAPHMILGLYGKEWAGATLPLQILCGSGFLLAIYHLGGSVAHATGNVFSEFRRQVIYAILVVVGSIIGSRWGISGVASGVAAAVAFMYVAMAQLALRVTSLGWRDYLRAQVPGLLLGAIVGAVALTVRTGLEWSGVPSLLIFGCVFTACAVALPCGIYVLPRGSETAALFGRISRAIAWAPTPLRQSINFVLRLPS